MKKILFVIVCFLTASQSGVFADQPIQKVSNDSVIEVSTLDELKQIISSLKKRVFVDFYSPHCPPCKRLSPIFKKYANENSSKGTFVKVNLNEVSGAGREYDISSMPTLLVFGPGGKLQDRVVGIPKIPNYLKEQ
ncbi:MAG: Thioredoxin-1 [Chlamydiae bacterium]|nr:Thioredoxin-1 [Chlamydiota bacterium]